MGNYYCLLMFAKSNENYNIFFINDKEEILINLFDYYYNVIL